MTSIEKNNKLHLVYGDLNLGIGGDDFHYIFSYANGGPVSLKAAGREWVYRTPKPAFWRALTDNDRGCGFHLRSGMWMAADQYMSCVRWQVFVDGQEEKALMGPDNNIHGADEYASFVKLVFVFKTITVPSAEVEVSYEINAGGQICVHLHYSGRKGLPEMPVFGYRMVMPTKADGFVYEGLSGETYPDRMAGGMPGVYEVSGLPVTPYLVPQECGMHMMTKWLKIRRSTSLDRTLSAAPGKLCVTKEDASEGFAFSCLPYTAMELEAAYHQEELPVPRRTVLCIMGAVRGVGGIDSWGTDVEEAYHISGEQDIDYGFCISFEKE